MDIPMTSKEQIGLLRFIVGAGRATPKQLNERFRGIANSNGKGAASWLHQRLYRLEAGRYIQAELDERDRVIAWKPLPRALKQLAAEELATAHAEVESQTGCSVAQPRRISMLDTGIYKPAPVAMRPGAMAYADVPSLHMGQRHAYRSGEKQA